MSLCRRPVGMLAWMILVPVLLALGCGSGEKATEGRPPEVLERPSDKRMFPLAELKTVNLEINGHAITAWIADDMFKIREGMMWLEEDEVRPDQGMLFVMPVAMEQSFWMKNTLIPLDLVFLDEHGKILNIVQGKPLDEETKLQSKGDALYCIELKGGAGAKLGAKPGQVVQIPAVLKYQG